MATTENDGGHGATVEGSRWWRMVELHGAGAVAPRVRASVGKVAEP